MRHPPPVMFLNTHLASLALSANKVWQSFAAFAEYNQGNAIRITISISSCRSSFSLQPFKQ